MAKTATLQAEDKLLSLKEVADRLGVERQTVRSLALRGKLRYIRIGRQFRFRSSWVDAFIDSRR